MNTRDSLLLTVRPTIPTAQIFPDMSSGEEFQNRTLRPVIKLQNDLILAAFRNYLSKHKNVFFELSPQRRVDYVENAIHKDQKFRNSMKGMIIGQFTIEEYAAYTMDSSNINKRMMNIVKERVLDQIQLLEKMPTLEVLAS